MKQNLIAVSNIHITLHWWNMGSKKLDFKGTISEYLITKSIKVHAIIHPKQKDIPGFRFKFGLSSRDVTMDIYHYHLKNASIEAIQVFLTILGDKALIQCDGHTIRVNH